MSESTFKILGLVGSALCLTGMSFLGLLLAKTNRMSAKLVFAYMGFSLLVVHLICVNAFRLAGRRVPAVADYGSFVGVLSAAAYFALYWHVSSGYTGNSFEFSRTFWIPGIPLGIIGAAVTGSNEYLDVQDEERREAEARKRRRSGVNLTVDDSGQLRG